MTTSKNRIIYIHIFIWLFAIFANLPYSSLVSGMSVKQIVSFTIGFLYLMFVFYLFYFFLAPLFLNRKKLAAFFTVSFLIVLILPFFGYSLIFLSRAYFDGTFRNFFRGYSFGMHMSGYYPVLTAAIFGSFFRAIINWFATMNQKAEIDKQMAAVELELLKSKLNPHFLFNTLNNIDSLITRNPEEASEALIRLSEIMRYLTYETKSEAVELKREIDYIRNLIGLYRIRINSPENIRFEVKGDLNVLISPALFVPLIENAFKFGNFRNMKPGVEIYLLSEDGKIVFEISNFYDDNSLIAENDNSGFGIINLKKRLELTYPGKHQLEIVKGNQQFKVKLIIDTNAD
jgi:two-component system LytT family sensor kinase